MSEHFLNGMQIGAVLQKMRGKGMPECVRRDRLFDASLLLLRLDDLPEALARHPFPADIDEQRL